jgi:hypothetical protein
LIFKINLKTMVMKTRLIFSVLFALLAGSVLAQYKSEMTQELTRDEVPSVVQKSLQKKTKNPGTEGRWTRIYFETTIENSHDVILDPEYYSYSCKLNGERMQYLFKPDGSLYQIKEKPLKSTRNKNRGTHRN